MSRKKPIKPPAPPQKTIQDVLDEFLEEQSARLKPTTARRYRGVIGLFKACMDGYGHQSLDESETALFNRHYDAQGADHREFCQLFGPDKIADNVGEFLGYFMVRKVMCGGELKRAAGTVTKKLGKWLCAKGYVDAEASEDMTDLGGDAARDLPAAERLCNMLAEYADRTAEACNDQIEDHFAIMAVEPGRIRLMPVTADVGDVWVPLPRQISSACVVDWSIAGAIARTRAGWRLADVWNVYP